MINQTILTFVVYNDECVFWIVWHKLFCFKIVYFHLNSLSFPHLALIIRTHCGYKFLNRLGESIVGYSSIVLLYGQLLFYF